ncbi:MAG: hypothetical protein ABIR80_01315 [Opitutaceae bacterium]
MIPPLPMPRFVVLPLLTVTMIAGGCGTQVTVDSLARPGANAVSYELRNANPLLEEDSLRYKELAGYVKTALSGKGMYEAPAKVQADVVVSVDFGIGPPQSRRQTVSEPVYRTVPGKIRTERVQIGTDSLGMPIFTTVTVEEAPTHNIVGTREYVVTSTVYEKYIHLSARETTAPAEGQPPAEIWTIDVTSEGESRDLRHHLPLLVAASIDYIGQDSQGHKKIRIKDSDKDVAFVKAGLQAAVRPANVPGK